MRRNSNEQVDKKKCACGCGDYVIIKRWHLAPSKIIPKFIHGHGRRKKDKLDPEKEIGKVLCACGCGENIILRRRHLFPSHSIPKFIYRHKNVFHIGNKWGWKNGEIKQNGYVVVYSPNHPNANSQGKGYVKRSRLVMEKILGRYLTNNEVVHHINGIRDDDRPENLVVTTHSKHQWTYHKRVPNRNPENGRFVKRGVMPYAQ